jgi:hypothetical protein
VALFLGWSFKNLAHQIWPYTLLDPVPSAAITSVVIAEPEEVKEQL